MSGPKVDHVELERRKQAELERARQERLRRIRVETENLDREITRAKAKADAVNSHLAQAARDLAGVKEMSLLLSAMRGIREKHKERLARALTFRTPSEPDAIAMKSNGLAIEAANIMQDFMREMKPHEERIHEYMEQMAELADMESRSAVLSASAEEMVEIGDLDFSHKAAVIARSDVGLPIQTRAAAILAEIEQLANMESIQEDDLCDLIAIADNIYRQAFVSNDSFSAAVVEYEVTKPKVVKNISVFDSMYHDYCAEIIVYRENRRKFDESATLEPLEKYRIASIDELHDEIKELSRQSMALSEGNYIREQINEVMDMYGYNRSEDVVFDANQRGANYICENRDGRSAIHIHVGDQKRLMMEIVGIGDEKALPREAGISAVFGRADDLNEHEASALLEQQTAFCRMHPLIVDELAKRGVILHAQSRKAPHRRYCRNFMAVTRDAGEAAARGMAAREAEKAGGHIRIFNDGASERREPVTKLKMQALKPG